MQGITFYKNPVTIKDNCYNCNHISMYINVLPTKRTKPLIYYLLYGVPRAVIPGSHHVLRMQQCPLSYLSRLTSQADRRHLPSQADRRHLPSQADRRHLPSQADRRHLPSHADVPVFADIRKST